MTNATQTSRNESMYGFADIDSYIESVKESITYQFTGGNMVVAGLMSDAQELMSFGNAQATDQARKNINIAKFILSEMMEARMTETV